VPVLGNRSTLEWESDRASQRKWLLAAGLRLPKEYTSPDEIDRKFSSNSAAPKAARAFSPLPRKKEFYQRMKERVQVGLVKEEDAEHFTIQEFLPGVRYYPHYFFSPLPNPSATK